MSEPLVLDLAACNSIRGVLEGALERDDAASLRSALAQLAAADAAGKYDELKQSQLAKLVKKRVARHADPQIASAARQLVAHWSALLVQDAAPAPAPAASSKAPPPGAEVIDLDTDDDGQPPRRRPPRRLPPRRRPPRHHRLRRLPPPRPRVGDPPPAPPARAGRGPPPPPASSTAASSAACVGDGVGGTASEASAAEDDRTARARRRALATARCRPCRPPRPSARRRGWAAGGRRRRPPTRAQRLRLPGAASADAWQRTCPICGEPLELEYSTRRHELVVPGAVTLNHRTYHEACIAARAMPSAG